jgi:hypothetical protein
MEAAAQSHPLPLLQNIDPGVRRFLDGRFRSAADLATASDVEAEIRGHCAELEASISNLYVSLQEAAAAYSSCREVAGSALRGVRGGLSALKAYESTGKPNTEHTRGSQIKSLISILLQQFHDSCLVLGAGEEMEARTEQMQFEQLPALASEVARVEMVREYAGEYRISGNHIPSMLQILNDYLSLPIFHVRIDLGIRVRAMNLWCIKSMCPIQCLFG